METPPIVSPQEWQAARDEMLVKEKEHTRARDALAAFTQGEGDVLLAYENEAIKAEEEGEDIEYVVPPSTIRIETPIAVTKDAPDSAQSFLDFIWSDEGQQIWSDNGYRPVNQALLDEQKFPVPQDLFDIAEFGGWEKVTDEFFDEDLPAARELAGTAAAAELFLYPGDQHLFADSSLDAYDPEASALRMERVQAFLASV